VWRRGIVSEDDDYEDNELEEEDDKQEEEHNQSRAGIQHLVLKVAAKRP
jgi:hypothetical protein